MAATAARNISVKVSGDPLTLTNEATTASANKTYQITAPAKRVLDPNVAVVVKNGGTAVNPVTDPYTVNRLSGTITFATATTRVITISGSYLPLSVLAEAHDLELTCVATNGDDSAFLDTDVTRQQLQRDCSGSIGRFHSVDTYLADAFDDALPVVIEFSPDRGTTPHLRVWALLNKNAFQGSRKAFAEETVSFEGVADADGRSHSFLMI